MFEISVQADFSAAHNLRQYRGKCEQLHGHNWQVEAVFAAAGLDRTGMVLDFKIARRLLQEVLRQFDHHYLNTITHFKKINPTSENLAAFIFRALAKKNDRAAYRILRVSVWETPLSRATYSQDLCRIDTQPAPQRHITAGRKVPAAAQRRKPRR